MYSDSNISTHPLAVLEPRKEPRRYTLAEYLRRIIVANMTAELIFAFRANHKDFTVYGKSTIGLSARTQF